jgi:hypothetical protein
MSEKKGFPVFTYPDGSRMCASGQRRAAKWGLELSDHTAIPAQDDILARAVKGERAVRTGADTGKHNLIAFVVADLATTGRLGEFMNPTTGDYTLHTFEGGVYDNNILVDIEEKKKIF